MLLPNKRINPPAGAFPQRPRIGGRAPAAGYARRSAEEDSIGGSEVNDDET
jgi:hypothetical protein